LQLNYDLAQIQAKVDEIKVERYIPKNAPAESIENGSIEAERKELARAG
jgi:hypothetical protein